MTSESRSQFEEWANRNMQYSVVRSDDAYVSNTVTWAWQAWSARDSEVERLREALKRFMDVRSEYGYDLDAFDAACELARSLLSSQVKESGK